MRLPVLLVAASLLGACATAAPTASAPAAARVQPDVAHFFPLAVGNSWTYQTRFGGKVERNTVRIEEKQGGYFRDNQRGALAFDGEGLRDERRYLILGPVAPGTTWESLLEDGKRERYEIVKTNASVEVPAGRFEGVLLVRGITPVDAATSLEMEWAYAPGVGLIRLASAALVGGRDRIPQATIELLEFRLAR
ncbi:hypothetical protein [Vulgatibacter sp.]|uniref:hypothetical protein n=1 Tax=Vulgatibacter sp. TaxID=1971226 RepID=UPI003562B8AA